MRLPALASLMAVSMALVGCTTRPVVREGTGARGEIATRLGRPGVVVAAPHATSGQGTAAMATEIARLTGFGLVVATGVDVDERRVREVAQGPLVFYVEIHGNDRGESAGRIEVATVGVDAEQGVKLRTLLELVRDAHLRARPPGLRLQIRVEPVDRAFSSASAARREGILRLPQRALYIELPRMARQEGREVYTLILADFLREAVALPLPARR